MSRPWAVPVEWSPAKRRQIGWRPSIQRKGQAGKPIGERDKARNKRMASPRARVEQVFASLAQMGSITV
ncbi:hypothetical protein [Azorhizophilus paspali]|uniref:Transposase DDE domain-containing protein n=1 Tax=Azorhizophilus paspali TaxID=69963 RepID=A0ABV6SMG0_AZOPA